MKTIIIYSGKGGVGKSTTTANLARSLSKNNKVYVLDGDVNTPSLNQIFKKPRVSENLFVNSMGFESKNLIYLESSMLRKYISKAIDEINEFKPDYVLIDTPPSLTDVHINLIEKFKVSGIIIVTQPSELSQQDVNRTSSFFISKGINIIGIIENMSIQNNNKYNWKLLSKIPFVSSFNVDDIYNQYEKKYDSISKLLKKLNDVVLENKIYQYTNESIEVSDLKNCDKFLNVKTWDIVRQSLFEKGLFCGRGDNFLLECTSDRIDRLLKAFKNDQNAYFTIVRSPNTEIDLIPGEIGEGSLVISDAYYGVPKVKYKTAKGEVILFPYEIIPANPSDIQACLDEGGTITKDGRYLPNKEIVKDIYYSFGDRVGLHEGWEERYDSIVGGENEN